MAFLVYSQVLMSLSGLALIFSLAFVHGVILSFNSCLLIFVGLMWVYLLDSSGEFSPEDQWNQKERLVFFKKHSGALKVLRLCCLLFLLFLALSMRLSVETWIFFAASAVMAWFYSVGLKGLRAKKIFPNKTWLVAMTWALGVYFSLSLLGSIELENISVSLMVVIFCLLFFDTALLDWRDRAGDKKEGIQSVFFHQDKVKRHLFFGFFLLVAGFGGLIYIADKLLLKFATLSVSVLLLSFLPALKSNKNQWVSFWVGLWRFSGLFLFFLKA